ncbi:hypothetical protein [Amycolatopsis albispora]|uniref:Uncharacterized protein n=1 Tax=Amycolatopsis albispora TaxID=1804986 RepID=A0A344LGY3_9PSEU|nr:hypothetical protein [Amycolatopsis albispora]AXB47307.1 hypothetical protein A4R43_36680 [Amycolatopsis albispora]
MADTWATEADVLELTNTTVAASGMVQAQATIDLHAGRIYADRDRIGARDRYWLKLATAYQAAWLAAQPDAFDRTEITSTGGSSDGVDFAPEALILAPFAAKALGRVSWRRSRSLRVRPPGGYDHGSEDDERFPWVEV